MNGLLNHLVLTLRLNFRSKQAIVYGYVVPIFFLIAFGSVFRSGKPALMREMGQLLTITVLGGACFGMPTAMVAERERGVWRRYRLLPTAIGGILVSAMVGRFVIVLSAALLQIALARAFYGTPLPDHAAGMGVAFGFVAFAFLGLGLVIAMLADTVPAVQALGQSIFLPMIMIGGVGVPLWRLPGWAQHVAGFLPGRYAVEALQACQNGDGLGACGFDLLALTVIGLAACVVGARMFRWDVGQPLPSRGKAWIGLAVLAWAAVGLAAERSGRQVVVNAQASDSIIALATSPAPGGAGLAPTTPTPPNATPRAAGPSTNVATPAPTPAPAAAPWEKVTRKQAEAITYDDVPDDDGTEVPLAANLERLDKDGRDRLEQFADKLSKWPPVNSSDPAARVRALLNVCAVADVLQDQLEAEIPYVIFEKLKGEVPRDRLILIVTWIIQHPDEGPLILNIKDLTDTDIGVSDDMIRARTTLYGKKLLARLLGKRQ